MEESEKIDLLHTLLPLSLVIFIIVLGVVLLNQQFNKKLYRQRLESEELKIRNQQELLRTSIQVQEDERKRIARDLHDELGAALSMARMHLIQLERQHAEDGQLPQKLIEIREITESALTSMRRISHELLPPQLESFGLLQTLQVLRQQISGLEQLEMTISANEDFPRFPLTIEVGLYRACLELVQNTLKHTQATQITISLKATRQYLQLHYTDNGSGVHPENAGNGLGRKNIEARIHALGGNVETGNAPNGGMFTTIKIPLTTKKK